MNLPKKLQRYEEGTRQRMIAAGQPTKVEDVRELEDYTWGLLQIGFGQGTYKICSHPGGLRAVDRELNPSSQILWMCAFLVSFALTIALPFVTGNWWLALFFPVFYVIQFFGNPMWFGRLPRVVGVCFLAVSIILVIKEIQTSGWLLFASGFGLLTVQFMGGWGHFMRVLKPLMSSEILFTQFFWHGLIYLRDDLKGESIRRENFE